MSALSIAISELQGNKDQWTAFNVIGHCAVLAPPGSGKTKLLTTRVAYDLAVNIERPQGAACVTLTNAAADELSRRLDAVGADRRANLFVGTVHGFALRSIVRPFAVLAGRNDLAGARLANRVEEEAAFNQAISEVFYPGYQEKYLRSTVDVARKKSASDDEWHVYGDRVRELAEAFEAAMIARGVIDFTGLINGAAAIVEGSPEIRSVLSARYPRLYVDEYQDLAPALNRLVSALCLGPGAGSQLFAVGDADQAVYGFTGTRPELLAELAATDGVTPVPLRLNYRSGADIIALAGRVKRSAGQVEGTRAGGRARAAHCPGGLETQYERAAEQVQSFASEGTSLHEIAVLCPQNIDCIAVADAIAALDIPVFVREVAYRSTPATTFVESCAIWISHGGEVSGVRLRELHVQWRRLLSSSWSLARAVDLTRTLQSFTARRGESALELIGELEAIGLATALADPRWDEARAEYNKMLSALGIEGSLEGRSVEELAHRTRRRGRVEVTTMTSSKGLEFDRVIVIGLDEEIVPHYRSLNDPAGMDEDRRKFYVSITRAREEIVCLYSGVVLKPWGDLKRTAPSRFLREAGLLK